jgi:hypothetical protein
MNGEVKAEGEKKRKSYCGPILLGIMAVIWIVTVTNMPPVGGGRNQARNYAAMYKLRSIASSQSAYQSTNDARVYGSFQALQRDLYISEGYTKRNMIENFSMSWEVNNVSTVVSEQVTHGVVSTFTVIAWPGSERRHIFKDFPLRTFGLTEDLTVRVYDPEKHNRLSNVQTWDPIL